MQIHTAPTPRVIVGLGNPGRKYEETRHNIGFKVIDTLLEKLPGTSEPELKRKSLVFKTTYQDRDVFLVKPLTYMNLSGEAVEELQCELNLLPEEVLIVCDCIDLDFGRLRLRSKGSSGGQKGVESVILKLGAKNFPRLRVGVGRNEVDDAAEFVLSPWSSEETSQLPKLAGKAAEAILCAMSDGVAIAMNRFNGQVHESQADSAENQ